MARFPNLKIQPNSGLTFPWGFYLGPTGNVSDANFGPENIAFVELMEVYWEDLPDAIQQLLGYSWRDATTLPTLGYATLRRVLPFQHPFYNQSYCTKIVKVEGLSPEGVVAGPLGPYTEYNAVRLTLQFTRPDYALLTDAQVVVAVGPPEEWLRYTKVVWEDNKQIISREGGTFKFATAGASAFGNVFPGSIGQPVIHSKVMVTWYQLPQDAVFDTTNFGYPYNLHYLFSTKVANPFSNPLTNTINNIQDTSSFGAPRDCLRYILPKIIPHPLQIPPQLMMLGFAGTKNLQYDVILEFDYFDPPPGVGETVRGHNLVPWADNLWYYATSVQSGNPQYLESNFFSIFVIN